MCKKSLKPVGLTMTVVVDFGGALYEQDGDAAVIVVR